MMRNGGVLSIRLDKINVGSEQIDSGLKIQKGTYVRLTVSDTGHGMDKRTVKRIFEPFFTKKEVGSGSGLGLSVVHGIVTNYSGSIEVESEPGKGSVFRIYLPQYSEEYVPTNGHPQKMKKGSGSILFVDDEKEITYMGKRMLESLGYTVEIKSDSEEAFLEFKKSPDKYDLIVTDQAMPKMMGTELITKIKEIRPDLKSIIITGYQDSLPAHTKENLNISEIISKPLILSDFSELIRKVLKEGNIRKAS
jgi:CheY-like chemotaxis protein